MATKLKVLLYDLETAPAEAYVWRATQDYIPPDMLIRDTSLLTWSAKWWGSKNVVSRATDEWWPRNDRETVESLAALIREADVIVAHNIEQFDLPMLNNRLLLLGQEPLPPVKVIDTYKLARKHFRLFSNKLDYLADTLGYGRKIKTDFDLWRNYLAGDPQARKRMVRYNKRDVILLEKVFNQLLPYVQGIPRLVDATYEGEMVCPYCGSADFQKRGIRRTQGLNYQRAQCNECLKYFRFRSYIKPKLGTMSI